ncbi:MAG: rane protein [Paenibacillaceae bacterium]|jgi:drug/metabolite transporter (DMT)-like permease|nr:rane protein [Paenibacillaceae bacterium]
MKRSNIWFYAGLILVAAIWGTNFALSRFAMDTFDPVLFAFIRFGGAVPFFFVLLWYREGSVGIPLKDALQLAAIGLMGITCLELLVMFSIRYTTLANSSLLNVAPWPIFAALFAPLFTKEKISARIIQGGTISLVGVAFVILGGGEGLDLSPESLKGILMALGASLIGALYNLASMGLMRRYSALRVTTWTLAFGALFMLPMTRGTWGEVEWTAMGAGVWLTIFYNIFLSTVVAFLMWNACMYRVGATRSNFFRYVVPAAAVVAGFILFDESVKVWQIAGAAFMAAGLVWIQRERV